MATLKVALLNASCRLVKPETRTVADSSPGPHAQLSRCTATFPTKKGLNQEHLGLLSCELSLLTPLEDLHQGWSQALTDLDREAGRTSCTPFNPEVVLSIDVVRVHTIKGPGWRIGACLCLGGTRPSEMRFDLGRAPLVFPILTCWIGPAPCVLHGARPLGPEACRLGSLPRGHADHLCLGPTFMGDPGREALGLACARPS
jgi:hypothetical protein